MIELRNARFKFFNPINLKIKSTERWAVTGPARTGLLEVLAGEHVANPPKARSYSWGKELWPSQAIARVEFGQGAQAQAPYIGARFESYVDEFDQTLRESLLEVAGDRTDALLTMLNLEAIADRWIVGLSNGQSRRAQIALALAREPRLLVVNDPFLGVDPANRALLDSILKKLPIPVILGLCTSQPLPDWITNIAHATDKEVYTLSRDDYKQTEPPSTGTRTETRVFGEPVLEIHQLTALTRSQPIFRDLDLTIRRGERVFLKGSNGSGKSTLMAIISADHPQGWSADIRMMGSKREVGVDSYFSINRNIGISSPELHAIFPRYLTASEAISTGYAGNFMRTTLGEAQANHVNDLLAELGVPNDKFGTLNKQNQKLVLFARAIVKDPALLLLDEAFSTLDDAALQKAFGVLDKIDSAVLVTGHHMREIPPFDKVVDLTALACVAV